MARVDKHTETEVQTEFYADFTNSFSINPITGALARVTNEDAVKQSLKNLVLTVMGERRFRRNTGSRVHLLEFEMLDSITADLIVATVTETITQQEKRVNLIDVRVGTGRDQNTINVTVVFALLNIPRPITVVIPLKRVR